MQHVPEEFVGPNSSHDRRGRVRHSPASLTYVKVGAANGGVILDVSESGMAIASAEPLTQLPLPPLSFRLPRLDHTFVTSAELVWHSDTKQSAGLRFGSLSDRDRLQIKNWIKAELYAEAFPADATSTQPDRKRPAVSVVPRPRLSSRGSNQPHETVASVPSAVSKPRIPAGFPTGLHHAPAEQLSAEKTAEFSRLFPPENPAEMLAAKAARAEREKARAAATPKTESPEYSMQFPSEHPETAARDENAASVTAEPFPAQADSEGANPTVEIAQPARPLEAIQASENPVSPEAAEQVVAATTETPDTQAVATTAEPLVWEPATPDTEPSDATANSAAVTQDATSEFVDVPAVPMETLVQQSAEPVLPVAVQAMTSEPSADAGLMTPTVDDTMARAAEPDSATEQSSEAVVLLPFIDAGQFAAEFAAPAAITVDDSAAMPEPAIDVRDESEDSDVPVHDLHPVAELSALPHRGESKLSADEAAPPAVEPPAPAPDDGALDFPNLADLPESLREPGRFSGGAVSDASVESLLAIAAAEESSERSFRALRNAAKDRVTAAKPQALATSSPRIATPAASRHVSLRSPSQQAIPSGELESGDKNFRGLVVAASFVLIALCFAIGYSSGVRWLGFPWFAGAPASASDSSSSITGHNSGSNTASSAEPSSGEPSAAEPSAAGPSAAPVYAANPARGEIPVAPKRAAAVLDGSPKSGGTAPASRDASRLPDSAAVAPDPHFAAPPLPAASATPASFFPVTAPAEGSPARMVELPDQVVFDSPKVLIRMRQYFFVLPEAGPEWKHKLEHLTIGDPAAKISPPPAPDNSFSVVRIRATIGTNGTVTNVRPLSGSSTLVPPCLEAIRQWRYQPTLIDGKPMEWQGDFTIEFRPAP